MKTSMIAVLAIGCLAIGDASGFANVAPAITPLEQVFRAELVFVGKVTSIEKDPVETTLFPNNPNAKGAYLIASIKVTENLVGAKGLTHVRVGFLPSPPVQPNTRQRFMVSHDLAEGQEGCFMLTRHHQADFHTQIYNGEQLKASDESYKYQLTTIKKVIRAIENPMDSLKAKEAADRQFAACALIMKYYNQPVVHDGRVLKREAIPAEESKLILNTLGEMEWGADNADRVAQIDRVFWMLNLTPNEGWQQPNAANGQDVNKLMGDAFSKWVKANADKHRIQRWIVEDKK